MLDNKALIGRMIFFNDTATTEFYTLSLHDALPISEVNARGEGEGGRHHADDAEGGLVERDRTADDLRVCAEALAPEAAPDEEDRRAAHPGVLLVRDAAPRRAHAQQLGEGPRPLRAPQLH